MPGSNIVKPYITRSIGGHGTLQAHQTFEDGKRALEDSDLGTLKLVYHKGLLNTIEIDL